MPRRIPDYPDAYLLWNYVASIGSLISVVGVVLFLYIIYTIFSSYRINSQSQIRHKNYFHLKSII